MPTSPGGTIISGSTLTVSRLSPSSANTTRSTDYHCHLSGLRHLGIAPVPPDQVQRTRYSKIARNSFHKLSYFCNTDDIKAVLYLLKKNANIVVCPKTLHKNTAN